MPEQAAEHVRGRSTPYRLDALEARQDKVEATLNRVEGKIDGLGLNGSSSHIRDLAAAAPALVTLATAAPTLAALAQRQLDAEAARRVRHARWGFLADPGKTTAAGVTIAVCSAIFTILAHHFGWY